MSSDAQELLRLTGLQFNPFVHLEASSDPYLYKYIVDHDIFDVAWDQTSTLIFAPPGGGKTATRVAVTRACWVGIDGAHPFPLPYTQGQHALTGRSPSPDEHLWKMVEAGASALLTGLAFRPERLLSRPTDEIRATADLLHAALPGPLSYYLDVLRDSNTPQGLTELLERTYLLSDPPKPTVLSELCDALASIPTQHFQITATELFQQLVKLLTNGLGFSAVLVLIDGVDAIVETQNNPQLAVDWVAWPLAQADAWSAMDVYIKGFFPAEIQAPLLDRYSETLAGMQVRRIVWTTDLLVEMLQKRIHVASDGRFASLDALAGPAMSQVEVERRIVESIEPLPRVALRVVQDMLDSYIKRTGGIAGPLEEIDVQTALKKYRTTSPAAGAVHPTGT